MPFSVHSARPPPLSLLSLPLSFLSRQSLSHSRISQHFMEPDGSLPCSQGPSTGPCPKPDQSGPYHPILSVKIHLNIILPLTSGPSNWSLSFWLSRQHLSPVAALCWLWIFILCSSGLTPRRWARTFRRILVPTYHTTECHNPEDHSITLFYKVLFTL
jgi:hypothetical protein